MYIEPSLRYQGNSINDVKWRQDALGFAHMKDSDFEAVSERYISITPIHLDLTNHASFREMKDWKF